MLNQHRKNVNPGFILGVKFIMSCLIGVLYFGTVKCLSQTMYQNALYFLPTPSGLIALVDCFVIITVGISVNGNTFSRLLKYKKAVCCLAFVMLVVLLAPFACMKGGTVADDFSIQTKNIFGKTTQQILYSDITEIDVSVKYGIQYNIKTKSGNEILICSDEAVYGETFKNDHALMTFDHIISQYASKKVTDEPTWIKPSNTRRFFDDEDVFQYFDDFFKKHY